MLNEGAIGVEAVPRGRGHEEALFAIPGHITEGLMPLRDFTGTFAQDAAQNHDPRKVGAIGARARPGATTRLVGIGHKVIDRGAIVADLGRGELAVQQYYAIIQQLGSANFPVPPVVVLGGGWRVAVGIHPVQG